MAKKKTASLTSPQGGDRGCLCPDGTYSVNCCDGSLEAQGIGATTGHVISNVTNTNQPVTVVTQRG